MWIELVVAACLYSSPADCREFHFQFVDERSLNRCLSHAQPYMANWASSHPQWRIVRWNCAYGKSDEHEI